MATPVYFSDATPQIKALIDRAGMTAVTNNAKFRRKLSASVVVARRGGAQGGDEIGTRHPLFYS